MHTTKKRELQQDVREAVKPRAPCRPPADSRRTVAIGSGALKMHRLLATSTPANQLGTMRARRRGGHCNSGQTSNRRIVGEPKRRGSQLMVRKLCTMELRVTPTNSITSDVRRHPQEAQPMWTHGVAFCDDEWGGVNQGLVHCSEWPTAQQRG